MTWEEITVPESLNNALYLAITADEVLCGVWQGKESLPGSRLLELRVFTPEEEFRAFRSYISDTFRCRMLADRGEWFDETHYLDQNSNGTEKHADGSVTFLTSGGGRYTLPGDFRKITVRTYLKENDIGIQTPGDWRIVRFIGDEGGDH